MNFILKYEYLESEVKQRVNNGGKKNTKQSRVGVGNRRIRSSNTRSK